MAATFPPLSERFLRRLLGPVAFARGQDIEANGGVALVRADGHGVEGRGAVVGDAWEASALVSGEEITGARCSCSAFARSGQPCKHLAALLLAAGRDKVATFLAAPLPAPQGSADSPEEEASEEALEYDVPAPAPPRATDVGAWLPAEEAPAVPRQLDIWILAEGNALRVQVLAVEGAGKDPVTIDPRAAMASQATRPTPDRPALRVLSEAALRGFLSPGGEVRVEGEDAAELLGALTGRRVFFGPDKRPLRYLTDVLRPRIDLTPLPSGGLGASVSFERKSDASRLSPGHGLWFPGAPGWHLDPDGPGAQGAPGGPTAQPVDRRVSPSALDRILGAPDIEETPERLVAFLTALLPRVASEIGAEMPRLDQALDLRPPVPTFSLEASGTLTAAQVTLTALYDDIGVPVGPTSPGPAMVVVPPREGDPRPGAARCDLAQHRDAASRLRALGFRPTAEGSDVWEVLADKAIAFWAEGISLLPDTWDLLMPSELGETVIREYALVPRARVSGGTEAIFLDLQFLSEGVRCRREDLALAVEEGRRYVPLEDRSFASFDIDFVRGLLDREREIRRGARPDGGINLTQGGRIQELLEQFDDFVIDEEARSTFHTIANIHSLALLRKPRCLQATLRPYQQQGLAWLKFIHDMRSGGILADDMGLGKMEPTSNHTLTPDGWVKIGSLKVGDKVMGSGGLPVTVTGVFHQGKKPVYRLTATDGASARCGLEHLWCVQTPNDRVRGGATRVISTSDIMQNGLKDKNGNRKWFIPIPAAFHFCEKDFPVSPYVLGALIANGSLGGSIVHTGPDEQKLKMAHYLPDSVEFVHVDEWSARISRKQGFSGLNEMSLLIKETGLHGLRSYEKFIPDAYLWGSIEQRTALLQGLMDNDGTISKDGKVIEYNTTSPQLAKDVMHIIRSLGGVAWMSTREPKYTYKGESKIGKTDHRVRMQIDFCPFRVSWKVERYVPLTKYPPAHAIESIEPAGEEDCVCIAVDAPDRLYVTEDFLLTHNTIQTVSILGLVKQIESRLRALIVCPTSLTNQWIREIDKFAPSIQTFLWHGSDRASFKEQALATEILVTSYPLLVRDEEFFRDIPFDYVILDEAQVIKNPRGATAKASKRLRSTRRLALTGTPISNRLADLWALFDFVNPDLLGTSQDFEERYAGPIGEGDGVMAYRLRQAVRPFMLRRTKEEVNIDLPSKVEIDRFCEMPETQRQFYEAIQREVIASIKGEIQRAEDGCKSAHLHILTGITRLRQAACDIRLIDREGSYDPVDSSGKIRVLREIMESCVAGGHKVLIFSSFTEVLGLVRQALTEDGVSFEYLDGSTKDRGDRVDRFQSDPSCSAFLISLKAGGTGLNLTAADVVVHMDPWWNPAAEDQATDRAHRIGQQRSVTVYRLYSQGTIEDKIILLKAKKRDIAASVLTSNVGASGSVTSQDYLELIGVTDASIVSAVGDVPVDSLPSEDGDPSP